MIQFLKQADCDSVVIFIHGFTGGAATWRNQKETHFGELLLLNPEIKKNFDVAEFTYHTEVTNMSRGGKLIAKIFGSKKPVEKNISVTENARLLATQLKYQLQKYKCIVFIAHSMGGLIAKSMMLDSEEKTRIKCFISLSVPHSGSVLATYGKLILNNENIDELAPLNPIIDDMTRRWIKAEKPETKYLYGTYDVVVPKESACPPETTDAIACPHDHNSITKPADENEIVVKICEAALLDISKKKFVEAALTHKEIANPEVYDDHLYVMKLLITKLTGIVISEAKNMFYNAEYATRTYSGTEQEKEALLALYNRIKALYTAEFLKLQGGVTKSSQELIANIYEKIRHEDGTSLKTALHAVDFFHKTGMLHQLADIEDHQIWWDKEQNMQLVEDYRKKNA